MHWGRQYTAPTELLDAEPGDAPKGASPSLGAGVNAFFCGVSQLQRVKIHEYLLEMHGFQCIRCGSVPRPSSCYTLGWAMLQKVHCLALAQAPMQFFGVVSCCDSVKICECLLKMHAFQCIGRGSVPFPPSCWTVGQAMRQKAHRLALVQASMHFLCHITFARCENP